MSAGVKRASVRMAGPNLDKLHIECWFEDGCKYAAVQVENDEHGEELAHAIANFLNGVQPNVWQPIETAPTNDCHVVDIWHPRFGRMPEQWFDPQDGWFICPEDGGPTHWMPLPEPPK